MMTITLVKMIILQVVIRGVKPGKVTPDGILALGKLSANNVRLITHHFADGERQRFGVPGDGIPFHVDKGDWFVVEYEPEEKEAR